MSMTDIIISLAAVWVLLSLGVALVDWLFRGDRKDGDRQN